MILEFLVLLACQLLGSWLSDTLQLPIPGPVVGMVLLFAYLTLRGGLPDAMAKASAPLLKHMSLLFIPSGAGILLYLDQVYAEWLAIVAALLVSTLLALLISAWTLSRLIPDTPESEEAP